MVIVRKDEKPGLQGFFYTFPDLNEYSTKDLYKRHPTLSDYYIYQGRADNIIVFSNGEKLNPITIEETIQGHPEVKGALVIGSNRFQAGLLLEPIRSIGDEEVKKKLIDSVWPLIEKANRDTVAHGQISKELITIASPDKPFLKSGKGTIQRAGTIQMYSEEIDLLYQEAERGTHEGTTDVNKHSEDSLVTLISDTFLSQSQIRRRTVRLDPDTDFFTAGIDSLQVMNVSRSLRASLGLDPARLCARIVYRNPTARRLARYILTETSECGSPKGKGDKVEEIQTAKTLYERYTHDLSPGRCGRTEAPGDNQTILLTGSTGALGSYLLDQLVRNPKVRRVVCLNRAEDGGAKQQQKQIKDRNLAGVLEHGNKVEYLHVDISKSRFGLSEAIYMRLQEEAHRIIHNAWPVNFNISTETFEPHIRGVRHLADFAAEAEHRIAVVFISSIATVHGWDSNHGPVPEQRMEDWGLAGNSYGLSKMIGSLVLEDAAEVGDFPAASIRVGQIAGPEADAGTWNRQEWFPSIITSSLYMGVLPRDLGSNNRVDWVPVERVARLVLDIIGLAPRQIVHEWEITGYFHATNASVTTWDKIAPAVQEYFGDRVKELVSFSEWVSRLEETSHDITDVDSNPALKLLETYRSMTIGTAPVVLDLKRTNQRSNAMTESPIISAELMAHWFRQWGFTSTLGEEALGRANGLVSNGNKSSAGKLLSRHGFGGRLSNGDISTNSKEPDGSTCGRREKPSWFGRLRMFKV